MHNVPIYETDRLTFYMYPKSVIIKTNLQSVRISYDNYTFKKKLDSLKSAIKDGDIHTFIDVADICNNKLKWSDTCVEAVVRNSSN